VKFEVTVQLEFSNGLDETHAKQVAVAFSQQLNQFSKKIQPMEVLAVSTDVLMTEARKHSF
jgi:hypothetical protein